MESLGHQMEEGDIGYYFEPRGFRSLSEKDDSKRTPCADLRGYYTLNGYPRVVVTVRCCNVVDDRLRVARM